MNIELSVQSEVRNIMDAAKDIAYRNLVKVVQRGDLSVDVAQLPGIKKIIGESLDQALFNASGGLTHILGEADKKLQE